MTRRAFDMRCAEMLLACGDGAADLDEKLSLMKGLRDKPEVLDRVDRLLLSRLDGLDGDRKRLHEGLVEAQNSQKELRTVLAKLSATPWYPAVYLGCTSTPQGERACVLHNNTRLVVDIGSDVDRQNLGVGQDVYLGAERNVIIAQADVGGARYGETAAFERWTSDSRVIVKSRDEEFILQAADTLKQTDLKAGDVVLWRKDCFLAYEKLESENGRRYILDAVPDMDRAAVGGQDANLQRLLTLLTAMLIDPDLASTFQVDGRRAILMVGPPGCGKTLMAQVAASEVSRIGNTPCQFAVVKPAEWESPWVGESQRNIRECFASFRAAALQGFVVVFMDEIEAVGRIRGGAASQHADRSLATLLAEWNGFENRGNVAIIGATNRKDLVDPALLSRFDVEIEVSHPNRKGAEAILNIHLPPTLPFSPNGSSAETTHEEAVQTAVSMFYSPNANNDLCVIRFRDGKSRTVKARELVSGRLLHQVARAACSTAFERALQGGERGIRVADMAAASSEAIKRLRGTLSPRNVRAYLHDLPQDVDVVAVDPVRQPMSESASFVNPV